MLLVAVTLALVAFVAYRRRESTALARDASLSRDLRDAAGDDAVRLAAVEEFETAIYRRLFYVSVVGPRFGPQHSHCSASPCPWGWR